MEMEYMSSKELLRKAEILYQFIDLFENYENRARNYCSSQESGLFTMNELHLLMEIEANPGIISAELVEKTRKSKSFISQVVTKLVNHGYIVKISEGTSLKKKQLYISAKGKQLCDAHTEFDEKALLKTYKYLLRDCTPEEIDSFYKVMETYNRIMLAAERKHKNSQQDIKAK